MGKVKGPPGVQNRHIYSRASYLYQAATYLASQVPDVHDGQTQHSTASSEDQHSAAADVDKQRRAIQNMSRQAIADMRAVSLKVQIRQSPAMKQTICKFCNTLLVEGKTCRSVVENLSKGGRKPWADILAIECKTCGHVKRYPVSAQRQKRRPFREQKLDQVPQQELAAGDSKSKQVESQQSGESSDNKPAT